MAIEQLAIGTDDHHGVVEGAAAEFRVALELEPPLVPPAPLPVLDFAATCSGAEACSWRESLPSRFLSSVAKSLSRRRRREGSRRTSTQLKDQIGKN